MKRRSFSDREKRLIGELIQDICKILKLDDRMDEYRNVGWVSFLRVYQNQRESFAGDGQRGWAAAAQAIYDQLLAEKTAGNYSRYYQKSLNARVSSQISESLIDRLKHKKGEFLNSVCFRDYINGLPQDAKDLAYWLLAGYSSEEIRRSKRWNKARTQKAFVQLKSAMEEYCQI